MNAAGFRIFRISAPKSIWIGCPIAKCRGFEVDTGITMGELNKAIQEHIRAHAAASPTWMLGGRRPMPAPSRWDTTGGI